MHSASIDTIKAATVTMSEPPADYRSMSTDEILDSLAIQIYEPPLSKLREDLRSVPEVLRIPVLIIDFDTEVCMQGILGFLENSTGFYLADTIAAMEAIGAHDTAATLRAIQGIMAEHGVTHERLRGDFDRMQEWQITTFAESHGEELSQMADLIGQESRKLYIYDRMHDREGEDVFVLLSAYIQQRRDELVALAEAYLAKGTSD
jgi:hypothetical protein